MMPFDGSRPFPGAAALLPEKSQNAPTVFFGGRWYFPARLRCRAYSGLESRRI